MTEGSRKAILAAFFANLGIAIAKFVGFLITSSAGLLAEAFHSLADTGNQGLLMLGGKRAERKPDAEHPFGYGRERYFWAFVVALVLFSLGGLFALYEGISKLRHPARGRQPRRGDRHPRVRHLPRDLLAAHRLPRGQDAQGPRPVVVAVHPHEKSPELPVVLLEDVGAEIGLFMALSGVLLAHFTDEPRWDALGSIAIGVLLVVIAIILAVEMKGLLVGESASPEDVDAIATALAGTPNVRSVIHMKTQHIGPDELIVAAKVEFDPTISMAELAAAINAAEQALRAAVPIAKLIYLEPDIRRASADERSTSAA